MYAFTNDVLQALLRDSCEDPVCRIKTQFLRQLDDAVRTNEEELGEGDWMPDPLAIFMQRETLDRVLERNFEEDADDRHVNAVSDTPSVIRSGFHHQYNYKILMDEG